LRGKREDEFRNESYPIVRRKCYDYVMTLTDCVKRMNNFKVLKLLGEGQYWNIFNCQEENQLMSQCFEREYNNLG